MLHEPLPSNYCRDYAWLQKSVGQSNILQYLDNFLPINFPDNDTANGPVSMSRDVGRH